MVRTSDLHFFQGIPIGKPCFKKALFIFKDKVKAFDDFKNKQMYEVMLLKYVNSESIQYTMNWDKTQMLKKFCRTKKTVQNKKCSLFSFTSSTVLLLICDSYMSWSTRFVSLNVCVRFSIFDSVSFY